MSEPFNRNNQFQMPEDHWKGPSRAMLRSAHRRKRLPGFPVLTPFDSLASVDAYLTGEKIQCLLCGKHFKSLGNHLVRIHIMPIEEYHKQYNIPWGRSLSSSTSKETRSQARKDYFKEHPEDLEALKISADLCRTQEKTYRPLTPLVTEQRANRLNNFIKTNGHPGYIGGFITLHCVICGVDLPDTSKRKCDKCKEDYKNNPERLAKVREKQKRHYYKDLNHSRALLRERQKRVIAKRKTSKKQSEVTTDAVQNTK